MSYTIEFNRQFIKTKRGFIPCWLVGENNVTEGHGRYERIARDWEIFLNMIDYTEDEMVEEVKKCFNEYDQHWKRNSDYITNEGLVKWIKSGCRKAATLEEILRENPRIRSVLCKIYKYQNMKYEIFSEENISTNIELERWINKSKDAQSKGYTCVIDFKICDLRHPKLVNNAENLEQFLLKMSLGYVYEVNSQFYYTQDIKKAKIFDEKTYNALLGKYANINNARKIKVSERNKKRYYLRIDSGFYAGNYLVTIRNSRKIGISTEFNIENLKIYTSLAEAKKAKDKYELKLSGKNNIVIEVYENEKI